MSEEPTPDPAPQKPAPKAGAAKPRGWHGKPGAKAPGGRKTKILVLGGLMLAIAGAIVAWFLYLREKPRPVFVALVVDEYKDDRLPVAAFAADDRTELPALAWHTHNTFTAQQKSELTRALGELKNQPSGHPVAVYIRAFAVTAVHPKTGRPAVALLPADARLDDPSTWLFLDAVLDALKDCPAEKRLLLLDLCEPVVAPAAGVLTSDVADLLNDALLAQVNVDKGLQVLAACAPGQASLTSEELGRSVFAHYLLEGLAGKADGAGDGKADGVVSVQELQAYVVAGVARWAWTTRRQWQTPVFYGSTEVNYDLTLAKEKGDLPAPKPLASAYPDGLRKGWELRDAWWADPIVRTEPEVYRQLEQALLRAEQRWRGGVDAGRVVADLRERIAALEAARKPAGGDDEPRSLAQAVARGRKPPAQTDAFRKKLRDLAVEQDDLLAMPKKEDQDKARGELNKKLEAIQKEYENKTFDLAWLIFQAASAPEGEMKGPKWPTLWMSLLRKPDQPEPAEARYPELAALDRVAGLAVKKPTDWPAKEARSYLQAVAATEKAAAADPAWQPWVEADRKSAAEALKGAEAKLFSKDPDERPEAGPGLDNALKKLGDVNRRVDALRSARATLDEALVNLPAGEPLRERLGGGRTLAEARVAPPGAVAWIEALPKGEADWRRAVQEAEKLRAALREAPAGGPAEGLGKVQDLQGRLREALKGLAEPLSRDKLRALIDRRDTGSADDVELMGRLLRLPALAAADRVGLYGTWRASGAKLAKQAAEAGPRNDPPNYDPAKAQREERQRGLARARASLALLQLDGAPEEVLKETRAALAAAGEVPEPAKVRAVADQLRKAWKQHQEAPRPAG
jgi:hypothetical protein